MNAGVTLFNTDFKDKITEIRRCTDTTGNASGQCMINGDSYKYISDRTNVDKAITRGVEATFAWDINQAWSLTSNYTLPNLSRRAEHLPASH